MTFPGIMIRPRVLPLIGRRCVEYTAQAQPTTNNWLILNLKSISSLDPVDDVLYTAINIF